MPQVHYNLYSILNYQIEIIMMKVLYIEDNPANLAFVERVLQMSGDYLSSYPDAESALDQENLEGFDLIITDIHLGEGLMDGLDFTDLLRRHGIHTPIVALTAYDFQEYEQRSFAVGSDLYMVKPISPQMLLDLLDQFRPATDD
ncbi:MAG: response regulator [Anaerolineae bacterium]|jgi:CheY-like chemotaxis protein|nr:response regulator [Anaerolineae bacterium]